MPPPQTKMHDLHASTALCRDCFCLFKTLYECPNDNKASHHTPYAGTKSATIKCLDCGGPRLICHPELTDLMIAHVDCDAFFAAVEKRDNPALKDQPVIIGGGQRGVVATACYVARQYGVHSAMPMFKALAACPHAVVIRPNLRKYAAVGRQIRTEMETLTPLVQPLSIDEAFLDLSGTQKLHRVPPAVSLAKLAARIKKHIGITLSIGLSHNKFLAKIASDLDKPVGYAVIGRTETRSFLARQDVTLISGVGQKLAARLKNAGYRTIGDLQAEEPQKLMYNFGETGRWLSRLAQGEDARPVTPTRTAKSISSETTFARDLSDAKVLENILWSLCEKVSTQLKSKKMLGRVVVLKLKTHRFKTITRRTTMAVPTHLTRIIFNTSKGLLRDALQQHPNTYRLLGVGIFDLSPTKNNRQEVLFEDPHAQIHAQEEAIDAVRKKFGADSIDVGRKFFQTASHSSIYRDKK